MAKKLIVGDPYVVKCHNCGKLILTFVMFGSGAYSCDCSPGEIVRFDFTSKEEIKKNQEKYKEFIESELESSSQ